MQCHEGNVSFHTNSPLDSRINSNHRRASWRDIFPEKRKYDKNGKGRQLVFEITVNSDQFVEIDGRSQRFQSYAVWYIILPHFLFFFLSLWNWNGIQPLCQVKWWSLWLVVRSGAVHPSPLILWPFVFPCGAGERTGGLLSEVARSAELLGASSIPYAGLRHAMLRQAHAKVST